MKKLKALLINGSPRAKGCTYTALTELKNTLEQEGMEVELIHVGHKDVHGCIACRKCKEIGKCVFDDIVNEVAPKFNEADAFVIGAPVYYASPAGGAIAFLEHNDEGKRDVPLTKTTPDNWADYDTVFIGYPIWWGIAAWPVNNFVKGNDFSGKTVIPFCTSTSSGLGQSGDLLADMAGTGNWQDGERFSSGASSSKVESWVNGLDLK